MVLAGLDFKWYDGFFLSMLASSAIMVAVNWNKYLACPDPLHVWIVVDYGAVFLFRCFTFGDNWTSTHLRRTMSGEERWRWFLLRLGFLLPLAGCLYPFLWYWTIVGSLWLNHSGTCLPEAGQKWGFLVWLAFCYSALLTLSITLVGKWADRRRLHSQMVALGAQPLSESQLILELLRDPDFPLRSPMVQRREGGPGGAGGAGLPVWVTPEQAHEVEGTAAFLPGLRWTPVQRAIIEGAIQQLPRYRLKALSAGCSTCPICLEDFDTTNEVRSLPCAHVFHVHCIDAWLRLNVCCPHCRCNVFPGLDLSNGSPASREARPLALAVLAESLEQRTGQSTSIPLGRADHPDPVATSTPHPTPSLSPHLTPSLSPFPTPALSPHPTARLSPRHRQPSQSSWPLLERTNSSGSGGLEGLSHNRHPSSAEVNEVEGALYTRSQAPRPHGEPNSERPAVIEMVNQQELPSSSTSTHQQ